MKKIDVRTFNKRQKIALVGILAVVLVLVGLIMWWARPEDPNANGMPYELSQSMLVGSGEGKIVDLTAEEYEQYLTPNDTFLVLAHNTSCPAGMPLTSIVKDFAHEHNIKVLGLMQEQFQASSLAKTIKFLPSLAVIRNGQVVAFLDAESDEDLPAYKSLEGFENWLKQYVKF